jgi:two-component system, NarL family, sensor kinase
VTAKQPPSAGGRRRFSPKTTARVAWTLWAVVMVISLAAAVLLMVTRSVRPADDPWQVGLLFNVGFLSYSIVGLIIAAHRPNNPLGWLLLLIGLILGLNELLRYYADYTLTYRPGALPAELAVGWVSTWIWAVIFPILPFVFLLFPDGRLPSRRSTS